MLSHDIANPTFIPSPTHWSPFPCVGRRSKLCCKKILGFSLLELLIVLVIIGILSTLSYPVYTQHLVNAYRTEAKIGLEKLSAALEQYFTVQQSYKNASLDKLNFSEDIVKHYRLVILVSNDLFFKIAAEPTQDQATRDTNCGTFLLDSTGKKMITGSGHLEDCW